MIAHSLQENIHKQIEKASKGKSREIFNSFYWIKINMFKTKK